MLGNSSFEGETAKMLCGCIRFGKKANAASYDVQSARQDSSSSGWSFHRSDAPSPEPLDISTDGCRLEKIRREGEERRERPII